MNISDIDKRLITPVIVLTVLIALVIAERLSPLRKQNYRFSQRLLSNICITLISFLAGSIVVRTAAIYALNTATQNSFGLLNFLHLNKHIQFVLGFLLLDMTFYYWHRLNHISNFLWRFHSVHHIDPDMDVTTSFRFHFGETLLSTPFRFLQAILLGVTPLTFIAYELCFQLATMFHHSNTRLPIKIHRLLNYTIVTPRMHSVHHSAIRIEHDSNYSVVFNFWDKLNRTMSNNISAETITIGVKGFHNKKDNTIINLLSRPFKKVTI